MRIEVPTFDRTALGRAVSRVAQVVGRFGELLTEQPKQTGQRGSVASAMAKIMRMGADEANRPLSKAETQLGVWQAFDAMHRQNSELLKRLESASARYAHTTDGIGNEPYSWGTYQRTEITPLVIAEAHRRSMQTGWQDWRVDLHARFLKEDSHVGGVDQIRRSIFYRAPLRIGPANGDTRPAAILLASAVRAAVEQMGGFAGMAAELAAGAMTGYGVGELAWRPEVSLSIPVGRRRSLTLHGSEVITGIRAISPRYMAFDVVDESPWLCYGPNSYVRTDSEGLQKFMLVRGDGQACLPLRSHN